MITGGLVSVDVVPVPECTKESGCKVNICTMSKSGICSQKEEIELMKNYLKAEYNMTIPPETSSAEVLKILMNKLNIHDELKLWQNSDFSNYVGERTAIKVVNKIFKPEGPCNSTRLLDNYNIDNSLEQWSQNGIEMFKKNFYHVPFQMIDFAKTNSELARLRIDDLIKKGYDCFGVILNTDISSGRGLHWFCIYGDLQHKGTKDDPIALEFFNSSGNPPVLEVEIWMRKVVRDLQAAGITCKIIRSIPQRIQFSNTECGVFSLIYILSRLENKPTNWFYNVKADDKDMIRYRQVLFRCPN